jgi:hypothetical protein
MSLKEILTTEEIGKIIVSSIPQDNGNRLFVYFNHVYPELEQGETIEYEGDIEDVAANSTKVFVEKRGIYDVEYTLKELIVKALQDEYNLVGEDYPYTLI